MVRRRTDRWKRVVASCQTAMESLEQRCLLAAAIPGISIDNLPLVVLPSLNGQEYVAASDGLTTRLFTTDGTQTGTVQFAEIDAVITEPLEEFVVKGDTLFFAASSAFAGNELWKTDGTATGTGLAVDVLPGYVSDSNIFSVHSRYDDGDTFDVWIGEANENFQSTGIRVAFETGQTGNTFTTSLPPGRYVSWNRSTTDGVTSEWSPTQWHIVEVRSSNPQELTVHGDEIYFVAATGNHSVWRTDGTSAGTERTGSPFSGYTDPGPFNLFEFDGEVFFKAGSSSLDRRMYRTDSATGQIVVAHDSLLAPVGVVDGKLVAIVTIDDQSQGLATLDSATSDPVIFATIPYWKPVEYTYAYEGTFTTAVLIDEFTVSGDQLYFTRREYGSHFHEHRITHQEDRHGPAPATAIYEEVATRWVSDLTEAGTQKINDLPTTRRISVYGRHANADPEQSVAASLTFANSTVYRDSENNLNLADGSPLLQLSSATNELPSAVGTTAYALGRLPDGPQADDVIAIDGNTGTVTALGLSLREADDVSALTDEIFVRVTTEAGFNLLQIDEDAPAVARPRITSPSSGETLPRGTVEITWDAVPSAQFYDVVIASGPLNGAEPPMTLPGTSTSYSFEPRSGDFEVFVRAGFADGTVATSDAFAFTVAKQPGPALIRPASGVSPAEGKIELRWKNEDVRSYSARLFRGFDNTETTLESWYGLNGPFLHLDLTAGDYRLEVTGEYFGNEYTELGVSRFTVLPGPAAPSILSPSGGETLPPNRNPFTWTAASGAASYEITVLEIVDGVESRQEPITGVTTTSHELVLDSGDYRVEIRARLADGSVSSAASGTYTVTKPAATAVPTLLDTEQDVDAYRHLLRWTEVTGAIDYDIWISNRGSSAFRFGAYSRKTAEYTMGAYGTAEPGMYTAYLRARLSGDPDQPTSTDERTAWSQGYDFEVLGRAFTIRPESQLQDSTTATLEWSGRDENTYEIAIYESLSKALVHREAGISGTTYTVPVDLSAGIEYDVWLRLLNQDGARSRWGKQPARMVIGYRPSVSFSGHTLTWSQTDAAMESVVQLRRIAGDGTLSTISTESYTGINTLTFLQLTPGKYRASVAGRSYGQDTPWADVDFEIQDTGAKPVPTLSYTGDTFAWSGFREIEMVIDEVDDDGNVIDANFIHIISPERAPHQTSNPFQWELPLPEGRFSARIRAIVYDNDQNPLSDFSEPIIIGGAVGVLPEVNITSVIGGGFDRTPEVTWESAGAGVTYTFRVRQDGAATDAYARSGIQGTAHEISTSLTDGNYTVYVTASHPDRGTSLPGSGHTVSVETPRPTFQVTDGVAAWSGIAGATRYELWVNRIDGAGVTLQSKAFYASDISEARADISSLEDGLYVGWLRAVRDDSAGRVQTVWSQKTTFSIGEAQFIPTSRPTLSVDGTTATWSTVPATTHYELWINEVDENGNRITAKAYHDASLLSLSVNLNSLAAGRYVGWLRALNSDGTKTETTFWSFRTSFVIS